MSTLALILNLLFVAQVPGTEAATTNLTIKVEGVQNSKGDIGVLIFSDESGYPEDYKKAFRNEVFPADEGVTTINLTEIPFGSYVVTVMHDENSNGLMDKSWLSIPKEGYGISNNPSPRATGPPKYEDGVIVLDQPAQEISIKMKY